MKLKFMPLLLLLPVLMLLLGACSGGISESDIEATVEARVEQAKASLVAPTAVPLPTYTPVPIPTPIQLPTYTPLPIPTPQVIIKEVVVTATPTPTPTQVPPKPTATATPTPTAQQVIEQAKRALVRIITDNSQGSGFAIWADGLVMTANHVVEEVESAVVQLPDKSEVQATIVGRYLASDIALLSLEGVTLPTIPLGDSDNLNIGDTLVKIGYGLGLAGDPTVAIGTVSAFREDDRFHVTYIQTDAPLNPGDSGGVLLNMAGEVVGINTMKFVGVGVEGVGFAVAVNEVKEEVSRLAQGDVLCQPIPDVLEGTERTNKVYRYKVTIPSGANWEYSTLDDGTTVTGRGETFVPGGRSSREFSSAVTIQVTLREPNRIRAYLDSWVEIYQDSFASVDVLSIRPVCVPSLGIVKEALEVEASVVSQQGGAPYRERWLTFFHGGMAFFITGYSWDTQWDTKEKFIDSVMYSIRFD